MRFITLTTLVALFLALMVGCKKEKENLTNETDPPVHTSPGNHPVPAAADLEDVSNPNVVVGDGTPASCTCQAFVDAVEQGGIITFNCGSSPHTIVMDQTAKIFNNTGPEIVIDGGGLITLDGDGAHRILYMNTCDQNQVWTTAHCQNQDHPRLTVQNLTFTNANSVAETTFDGGGAIWIRGGRFKAVNCTFTNNVCASTGPDVGGGALRVFSQFDGQPVFLTNCTFGGGPGLGNSGSNGGAISSIGVSWSIYNSTFSYNEAIGNGGNPAQNGTPGGGSGGAIYNDGNTMSLKLYGCTLTNNAVVQHGASIIFVSNNHTGNIHIQNSFISANTGGSWYPVHPSISMHSDTPVNVINSTIE